MNVKAGTRRFLFYLTQRKSKKKARWNKNISTHVERERERGSIYFHFCSLASLDCCSQMKRITANHTQTRESIDTLHSTMIYHWLEWWQRETGANLTFLSLLSHQHSLLPTLATLGHLFKVFPHSHSFTFAQFHILLVSSFFPPQTTISMWTTDWLARWRSKNTHQSNRIKYSRECFCFPGDIIFPRDLALFSHHGLSVRWNITKISPR